MIKIKDKAILVGVSELRNEIPHIMVFLKDEKVILTKKGKPIGVIESFEEYERKEDLLENFEDIILGHLAKERDEKAEDFISEEEMKKLIAKKK